MHFLIFKTDLSTPQKVGRLRPILNKTTDIQDWSVDVQDIDHVLRIVASGNLQERDILNLISRHGVAIEALPD